MNYELASLINGCKDMDILLSEDQKNQFIQYYELLTEWNKVMNLTAIIDFQEVLVKHFLDSLSISQVLDMNGISSVIDVGTGAGFPGIPLKIIYPHLQITLLDSLKKRIGFLNQVIEKLELDQIETIHGRAEDFSRKAEYRERFDLCVSRAVANMTTLSEYCLPYVKKNGYFIPYKSGKIQDELDDSKRALKILGGKMEKVYRFQLANSDMGRSLVLVKKYESTPKRYPRKAGLPSKEPIY